MMSIVQYSHVKCITQHRHVRMQVAITEDAQLNLIVILGSISKFATVYNYNTCILHEDIKRRLYSSVIALIVYELYI